MKLFIYKTLTFSLSFVLLVILGFFIPCTPRAKKTELRIKPMKDSLFEHTPSPRIILIGGSNVRYGINSQILKDSLGLNPVNLSINASIGLIYMLQSAIEHVRKNDVIIVIPEYQQFYGDVAYGREELYRIIMDNNSPKEFFKLLPNQFLNFYPIIPKYNISKFFPSEYLDNSIDSIHSIYAFNKYGDEYLHWTSKQHPFLPTSTTGEFNNDAFEALLQYKMKIASKGAKLFISFPCLQDITYDKSKAQIDFIYKKLSDNNFTIISNPINYKFPDSLFYDSPYHLLKKGVDIRTNKLVQDIKKL